MHIRDQTQPSQVFVTFQSTNKVSSDERFVVVGSIHCILVNEGLKCTEGGEQLEEFLRDIDLLRGPESERLQPQFESSGGVLLH